MNPSRPSRLPGCVSTGGSAGRRKHSSLRWCAANQSRLRRQNRPPRERSWADAAALTQPDATVPPPVRPVPRPLNRTRVPLGPPRRSAAWAAWAAAIRSARTWTRTTRSGIQLAWAWIRLACTQVRPEPGERLADWLVRGLRQLGDLTFAVEDQEAAWHAWNVERRCAGLGRLYRDQRFDALAACPRCQRISTLAGRSVCPQCSAADHLVRS